MTDTSATIQSLLSSSLTAPTATATPVVPPVAAATATSVVPPAAVTTPVVPTVAAAAVSTARTKAAGNADIIIPTSRATMAMTDMGPNKEVTTRIRAINAAIDDAVSKHPKAMQAAQYDAAFKEYKKQHKVDHPQAATSREQLKELRKQAIDEVRLTPEVQALIKEKETVRKDKIRISKGVAICGVITVQTIVEELFVYAVACTHSLKPNVRLIGLGLLLDQLPVFQDKMVTWPLIESSKTLREALTDHAHATHKRKVEEAVKKLAKNFEAKATPGRRAGTETSPIDPKDVFANLNGFSHDDEKEAVTEDHKVESEANDDDDEDAIITPKEFRTYVNKVCHHVINQRNWREPDGKSVFRISGALLDLMTGIVYDTLTSIGNSLSAKMALQIGPDGKQKTRTVKEEMVEEIIATLFSWHGSDETSYTGLLSKIHDVIDKTKETERQRAHDRAENRPDEVKVAQQEVNAVAAKIRDEKKKIREEERAAAKARSAQIDAANKAALDQKAAALAAVKPKKTVAVAATPAPVIPQ